MAPILYYDHIKPGSRALLLAIRNLNVEVEYKELSLYENEELASNSEAILVINNEVINDYHEAVRHLENYSEKETPSIESRGKIEEILNFDAKILWPPLKNVLDSVLVLKEKEITIDKIRSLQNGYNHLEEILQNCDYLTGDVLTIADLCCLASVSTATIFTPIPSAKYPKLFQWFSKCKQLPYYKEANSAGLAKLDLRVEEKLGCVNRS